MARERPTASDVQARALTCIDGGLPDGALAPLTQRDGALPPLTRAEACALRRSAPLTHAQLRRKLDVLARPLRAVE